MVSRWLVSSSRQLIAFRGPCSSTGGGSNGLAQVARLLQYAPEAMRTVPVEKASFTHTAMPPAEYPAPSFEASSLGFAESCGTPNSSNTRLVLHPTLHS